VVRDDLGGIQARRLGVFGLSSEKVGQAQEKELPSLAFKKRQKKFWKQKKLLPQKNQQN